MSVIPSTTLDYTDRDFNSLKLRLQNVIMSVFPTWTDFEVANFGNILVELMCHIGDMLSFYQDNQALEAFWPMLRRRISAIRHSKLIGYTMGGASAATGTVTIAIDAAAAYDLPIPEGARIRTTSSGDTSITVRTTADATLLAGYTSVDVAVKHAERKTYTTISSGAPNQVIPLANTPFLEGSIDTTVWDGATLKAGVTAINGDYTRVDSYLGYTATDRVFIVDVDDRDKAYIRFGNGVVGAIPQGQVDIAYEVGGGLIGNVEAGALSIVEDALYYATSGAPASVTATNASALSGGADRESLEEARILAPASLKLLDRCVARRDFETAARNVSGVARSLMATGNEYSGIPENTGVLYIVALGPELDSGRIQPATPTSALLASVQTEIDTNSPPTITFSYSTAAAPFLNITVYTKIYLAYGYVATTVAQAVSDNLYNFFAVRMVDGSDNTGVDFGANIRDDANNITPEVVWSDIFDVVKDTAGVRKVSEGPHGLLLNGLRNSPTLLPIEFPRLVGVTVVDAATDTVLL